MPDRQIVRRDNNQVGRAVARGVAGAIVNQAMNQLRHAGMRNVPFNQATQGRTQGATNRKRRRTGGTSDPTTTAANYGGGNDLTTSRTRIGRKKRTTRKRNAMMIRALMSSDVYRFQNITNYDTNMGAILLRNARDTTTGSVESPVHIYDLTAFPNDTAGIVPGYRMGWIDDQTNTANFTRDSLPGQGPGGVTTTGSWQPEDGPTTSLPAAKQALHNWTDIRFNFYGCRKRTTYFEVMFIVLKHEFADLLYGGTTNISGKLLLQYLERPLIYNNLQTDVGGSAHTFFKVIKRKRYYVSAGQTTDVDTTIGKIKEAKIFMNHDRMRNFDWQHGKYASNDGVLEHTDTGGLQFVRDGDVHDMCAYNKRVYMVVRAFAPERRVGTTAELATGNPLTEPSYDVIIRNKWSFVRSQNS